MRPVCSYTDFFVIATGQNPRQTAAIYNEVHGQMKRDDVRLMPKSVDGQREATWIVADYIDVLADDGRITAIGLYLESIPDMVAFAAAALNATMSGMPSVSTSKASRTWSRSAPRRRRRWRRRCRWCC